MKGLGWIVKIPDGFAEWMVRILKKHVYAETTERPELELVNKLHAQYDKKDPILKGISPWIKSPPRE